MAGRDSMWRPAPRSQTGHETFKPSPIQQVAILSICTPDVQGMLRGLLRQWLAIPKLVRSQEIGLETPPERLWRGRNHPGRRATPPFKEARERQNRRDDSGTYRRRKFLGQGPPGNCRMSDKVAQASRLRVLAASRRQHTYQL